MFVILNGKTYKMNINEIKSILFVVAAILFVGLFFWLFKEKKEEAVFKKLVLFPRWFKYVGLFVFVAAVIIPFHSKFDLLIDGKNYVGLNFANLGLFLICFSRDKHEDEMSNLIRLKAFYRSVILGFVYVFVMTATEFIHGERFESIPAVQLITFTLLIYLVDYYITKSKIRSAE